MILYQVLDFFFVWRCEMFGCSRDECERREEREMPGLGRGLCVVRRHGRANFPFAHGGSFHHTFIPLVSSICSTRLWEGLVFFSTCQCPLGLGGQKSHPPLGSRCKVRGPIFSATIPMLQGATPASHLRP